MLMWVNVFTHKASGSNFKEVKIASKRISGYPDKKEMQKKRFPFGNLSVGLPGLEPGKAGPESAVLPLHHSPMLKCDAKVQLFFVKKIFSPFFCLKK